MGKKAPVTRTSFRFSATLAREAASTRPDSAAWRSCA